MVRAKTDSPTLFDLTDVPTDAFEQRAGKRGARLVAGLDEAGRGPLAGPVVAAAVIFNGQNIPNGINDSKKLTAAKRNALYELIVANAHVAVAVASAARIDRMNILRASLWAMGRALAGLSIRADYCLVDGRDMPDALLCPGEAIVGGDRLSVSIAAASIVAKVTRDRLMGEIARSYPEYGFERHRGYGTKYHLDALARHGPCRHHRKSFAPVKKMLAENAA